MKNLLTILSVLIVAAGCENGIEEQRTPLRDNYSEEFSLAKESIRAFAQSHFDSNYVIMQGSVGSIDKFDPPIKPNTLLSSDSLIDSSKTIHFEQVHLGVPTHRDSLLKSDWTYYQLDENFNVVSYTKYSMLEKK